MSNQQLQMSTIRRLISVWITEIRLNSYENYTDINRVSERLCRLLVNHMYDYDLEDLNRVTNNFPGLDIGNSVKDMIAYQVTTRTDNYKIISSLELVVEKGYHNTFSKGIRFLILNDRDIVDFGRKSKKTPSNVLRTFSMQRDIIYPKDLIRKIEDIYEKEADLLKFNQIKALLEKELVPLIAGNDVSEMQKKNDDLVALLTSTLEKLKGGAESTVNISTLVYNAGLKIPELKGLTPRTTLVNDVIQKLMEHEVVWLEGTSSIGKTSIGVLIGNILPAKTLWIECRDIKPGQLVEYLMNSLAHYFGISLSHLFEDSLSKIIQHLKSGNNIIINDLTNIGADILLQRHVSNILSAIVSRNNNILIISNYSYPISLSQDYGIDIQSFSMPGFAEEDTFSVLKINGADDAAAALIASTLTTVTQGHPILIQSASKYFKDRNWETEGDILSSVFLGKFGDSAEKESYARVLEFTTDQDTRELLYRLRYTAGNINMDLVIRISSVVPAIPFPAEKVNSIKGIWLQEIGNGEFQLSPLIKILDGNIDQEKEKEIHNQLALAITDKNDISQLEAFKAIHYSIKAEKFNRAGLILFRVLSEFINQPDIIFDWGFNLFWWAELIPHQVNSVLKVQIRVQQIILCLKTKRDAGFLIQDLRAISESEDDTNYGKAMANLLFFQIETIPNPLLAFEHLKKAQDAMTKLNEDIPQLNLLDDKIMNGIWLVFSQIHSKKDYLEWFRIFDTIRKDEFIADFIDNSFYIMAGFSIYGNAVLKNKDSGEDISTLLREIIQLAQKSDLGLIATYSLKYLIKYLSEDERNLDAAHKVSEEFEIVYRGNTIYEFLVLTQLGINYFFSGNLEGADYYFREFVDAEIPEPYVERLDYLIAYMQVTANRNAELSSVLVNKALSTSLKAPGINLEDKVKLYGEKAIASARLKDFIEALHLYEKGFELLLESFTNNTEQQSLVIRYGNAIRYISEMIELGSAPSFGGEKWVIPETGYFFDTNERLLAGGFYFDERKFIVAYALQNSFELILELDKAKKWAYKCFELSLDVVDAQYIPILQTNLFYLIEDNQYRQAYNVLSHIDKYYAKAKLKAESGEDVDDERKKLILAIKNNDFHLYAFVVLPIAFKFTLQALKKSRSKDEFRSDIDDAFENDQYSAKDPIAFELGKKIFEKVLIEDITYEEMQSLLTAYTGEYRDMLYMIGCLLLSSQVTAVESANLQLAIILTLDSSLNNSNSLYKYYVVPFFINFWEEMIKLRPVEFTERKHLMTKGFQLVNKKVWKLKIPTLFRVLSDHLKLHVPGNTRDFIEKE